MVQTPTSNTQAPTPQSDLELPSINEFLQNSQGRTPESQIRSILQGVSGLDPALWLDLWSPPPQRRAAATPPAGTLSPNDRDRLRDLMIQQQAELSPLTMSSKLYSNVVVCSSIADVDNLSFAVVQQTSSQLSQVTAPSPLAAGVQHQQLASFPSGGITTPMVIDAAQISGPGPAASSNVVPEPAPSAPTQTDNLDNTALAQEGGPPVLPTPTADQAAAASTAVDQAAVQTPAAAAAVVDQSAVQTVADPPSLPSASTTTAAHRRAAAPGDDATSSSSKDDQSRADRARLASLAKKEQKAREMRQYLERKLGLKSEPAATSRPAPRRPRPAQTGPPPQRGEVVDLSSGEDPPRPATQTPAQTPSAPLVPKREQVDDEQQQQDQTAPSSQQEQQGLPAAPSQQDG